MLQDTSHSEAELETRAGKPAAEYVRMSTDHQQYSTANQSQAIREYAARHGFRIEKTYEDSGKSGLNLDNRQALKQLIEDVQNGTAEFATILVYDVSRWGRFQDADESAYYEYICKRPVSRFVTAPNNLRMTGARSQPSSKASSARWRVSTAGNCP